MKKITIGIDAHVLGDKSGGNESYYRNILKYIKVPDDMEIFVFVNSGQNICFLEDKYHIVEFKSKGAFRRNFIELPILCKKYNLDILHTQYFIPFYRPCPVVCLIHDICFEHYKNIFTKKEYIRQKLLIPYAAKKSDAVFTVSNYSKKDIASCYAVESSKIKIAYSAADNQFCKIDKTKLNEKELREKFNIGINDYILCVGNLQPRKNLTRLFNAFYNYNKKNNSIKLVIVGKKAWLYDKIFETALENVENIIFTDYVSNYDLVRLYNAAIGFIYPSFFEGFGLPPLEAMACGTPVAVSQETSLPEVVGNAGEYFDPFSEKEIEQALETLVSQKVNDLYKDKRKEQVKKFSWEKTGEVIISTYREIYNSRYNNFYNGAI